MSVCRKHTRLIRGEPRNLPSKGTKASSLPFLHRYYPVGACCGEGGGLSLPGVLPPRCACLPGEGLVFPGKEAQERMTSRLSGQGAEESSPGDRELPEEWCPRNLRPPLALVKGR